jgi:hypothetical protein
VATMMHEVDVLHAIPANRYSSPEGAVGVDWIVQIVPFHRSTSGSIALALLMYEPVAVHVLDDVHETAPNSVLLAPVGATGVLSVHSVPFRISANGIVVLIA